MSVPLGQQAVALRNAIWDLQCKVTIPPEGKDNPVARREYRKQIAALEAALDTLQRSNGGKPIPYYENMRCPDCGQPAIENWQYVGDHSECIPF